MAAEPLLIARPDPGRGGADGLLLPAMANRHLLIAGATGTGKTVSVQRIVEQFSRIGVPSLLTDVKGDLSGLARPGGSNPAIEERRALLGLEPPARRPARWSSGTCSASRAIHLPGIRRPLRC